MVIPENMSIGNITHQADYTSIHTYTYIHKCTYMHTYMHAKIMEKEAINFQNSKEGYMGRFRKKKGEIIRYYYNLKQ